MVDQGISVEPENEEKEKNQKPYQARVGSIPVSRSVGLFIRENAEKNQMYKGKTISHAIRKTSLDVNQNQ